jgi:hypothetical protein
MTKGGIIEGILKDSRTRVNEGGTLYAAEADNEQEIIETLEASLKGLETDADIRTCEDFGHLNVACCETCHTSYPHFEMSLIDLETGGNAWICCALDRALNPEKHERLDRSPEYKEILRMFASDDPN